VILIGIGSSSPFAGFPPEKIVAGAIGALGRIGRIAAASSPYRFAAWPDPADPPFLNAVVAMSTRLGPRALLAALQGLEAGFGRRRGRRYGPRTLDLDLLDYQGIVLNPTVEGGLALPHPRLAEREFVLRPLFEIAPDWRHPVLAVTAAGLLAGCADGAPSRS
jgi:2-amino-4-hydroxy-6-hydroxymethyldihydropteridine diphosphokinase